MDVLYVCVGEYFCQMLDQLLLSLKTLKIILKWLPVAMLWSRSPTFLLEPGAVHFSLNCSCSRLFSWDLRVLWWQSCDNFYKNWIKIGTVPYRYPALKKSKIILLYFQNCIFYLNVCLNIFLETEPVKIGPAPQHWQWQPAVNASTSFLVSLSLLFFLYLFLGFPSCLGDAISRKQISKNGAEKEISTWTAIHRNCKTRDY